jgi:hypothetical protein
MGQYFAQKPCFHRLWWCHRSAQSLALEVPCIRKGRIGLLSQLDHCCTTWCWCLCDTASEKKKKKTCATRCRRGWTGWNCYLVVQGRIPVKPAASVSKWLVPMTRIFGAWEGGCYTGLENACLATETPHKINIDDTGTRVKCLPGATVKPVAAATNHI